MGKQSRGIMTLLQFLSDNGFEFNPIFDEEIHRFQGISKKSKSGWYIGKKFNSAEYLLVGDWANGGEALKWSNKKANIKTEAFKEFLQEAERKHIADKIKGQEEAAAEAARHLARAKIQIGVEQFEYCRKKKISSIYNADFCEDNFGPHLAIPLVDISGKLCSLQKIYSDGHKMFLAKGKKKACFFQIGERKDGEIVYVCEGFSTGASIHDSTKRCVFVAFDAGNITSVAGDLKKRYPAQQILVCADNDQFGEKNTGIKAAQECKLKHAIDFVYPTFSDGHKDQRPTDFNDLYCLSGPEAVKAQIEKPVSDEKQDLNSDEYLIFKNFFQMTYPTAKKCFLTGEVTFGPDNDRKPIVNQVKAIRAQAMMMDLPKSKVEDYLYFWMDGLEPEPLCTFIEYDGTDPIGEMLSYITVSNIQIEYFHELMKEWFAGIFKRVDDYQFQNRMPILFGKQRIGKDTWIQTIFKDLSPYFSSIMLMRGKEADTFQTMSRSLVINISEFEQSAKMEVSQIKNMITAPDAMFRTPYDRAPDTKRFRVSFISTSNFDDIFRDESGNLRFMFFEVASIDWEYPKNTSARILAQARHLANINFKASTKAKLAMEGVLDQLTPESIYDVLADDWNERLAAMAMRVQRVNNEFSSLEVKSVIKEISVENAVSPKFIRNMLHRKRYALRRNSERFFTFDSPDYKTVTPNSVSVTTNDKNDQRVKLPNLANNIKKVTK